MGTAAVLVRLALVAVALVSAEAIAQSPGPPPREIHFDKNGYPLPPGAVARLGVPPPLSGFPWALAWSADGKQFVVADYAGLTVFDAATGRIVETQSVSPAGQSLFTPLSHDGRLLFILTGQSGTLYDTVTADVHKFTLPAPFADPDRKVYSLSLSADCRFLAGVAAPPSRPGVAWRYDLARDRFTRVVNDRADLGSVRLSPDGKRLYATGGKRDPELTARDLRTGRELWTVALNVAATVRVVSADGRRLAASDENSVRVFDAADGQVVLTAGVGGSTPHSLWAIDLTPDGTNLAVSDLGELTVWDVTTGKVRQRIRHIARLAAFAPDGKSVVTAGAWVQRWDVETGKPTYPAPVIVKPAGPSLVSWSGDGQRLLTVWPGDRRGEARDWRPDEMAVWDVSTATPVWQHSTDASLRQAALDWTGSTVRASTHDNRLREWRLSPIVSEAVVPLADLPNSSFRQFHTFLADGRLAVQTLAVPQADLGLYGPGDRRALLPPYRWPSEASRNEISRYGRGTTTVGPAGSRVDLLSNRPLPPLQAPGGIVQLAGDLLATPDSFVAGRVALGNGRRTNYLWEAATGRVIGELPDYISDSGAAALSVDGRRLAFPYLDRIGVRDLASPDWLDWFVAPDAKALAFRPYGRHLASAHSDGTILVWEVPPGRMDWGGATADRVWDDLRGEAASLPWKTLWRLLDHPDRATELLRARMRPVPAWKDTRDVIGRLDHPRFAVREEAARELTNRGVVVEGDLREALSRTRSAEQRTRLEQVLNKLDPSVPPSSEVLRALRCVWLLERIGSPEAKKLLAEMATGASGSRVTNEAKAALERLTAGR